MFSPSAVRIHDTLVITFFPFSPPEKEQPLFRGVSRESLRKMGYDSVHVMPVGNHWYQYADMDEALRVISTLRDNYKRAVTFGQSMGGYGALHSSAAIRADRVVALCCQYTIDAGKVDFDPGWQHYVKLENLKFTRDVYAENVRPEIEVILGYDPLYAPDNQHVLEIKKRSSVVTLAMPLCGHEIGKHLAFAGMMPGSLNTLISGGINEIHALRRTFRKMRRSSPEYMQNFAYALINRLKKQRRYELATEVARQYLLNNLTLANAKAYYEIAEAKGDLEETARRLFELIGRFGDNVPVLIYKKCIQILRGIKDYASAEALVDRLLVIYPLDRDFLREYAEVAHLQKKWVESKSGWERFLSTISGPIPAMVYLRLTQVADALGDASTARSLLDEGLRHFPNEKGLLALQTKYDIKTT